MSQDGIDSVVGKTGLSMCRIASLFLLQRLKGSMSGDARDFNNIETRALIKLFFFLQGKAPKDIHAILTETLAEYALSYATVKNWVAILTAMVGKYCNLQQLGEGTILSIAYRLPKDIRLPVFLIRQLLMLTGRVACSYSRKKNRNTQQTLSLCLLSTRTQTCSSC